MFLTSSDAPSDCWQALLHELHRGALDAKHPFRYLTLATAGSHFPQVRTVVLRQFTPNLEFLVYTDVRSAKIQDLLEVPRASLLFYHPKKQIQVRVKALVTLHAEDELAATQWAKVPTHRQLDYSSILTPGARMEDPSQGWEREEDARFFSVLKFTPLSMELLQLDKGDHLRIQFDQASGWQGTWICP